MHFFRAIFVDGGVGSTRWVEAVVADATIALPHLLHKHPVHAMVTGIMWHYASCALQVAGAARWLGGARFASVCRLHLIYAALMGGHHPLIAHMHAHAGDACQLICITPDTTPQTLTTTFTSKTNPTEKKTHLVHPNTNYITSAIHSSITQTSQNRIWRARSPFNTWPASHIPLRGCLCVV